MNYCFREYHLIMRYPMLCIAAENLSTVPQYRFVKLNKKQLQLGCLEYTLIIKKQEIEAQEIEGSLNINFFI